MTHILLCLQPFTALTNTREDHDNENTEGTQDVNEDKQPHCKVQFMQTFDMGHGRRLSVNPVFSNSKIHLPMKKVKNSIIIKSNFKQLGNKSTRSF